MMKQHKLTLTGGVSTAGVRVSLSTLTDALTALLEGARAAARFTVEGESVRKGKRPAWLDAACEFDVVGLFGGSAIIDIEAPLLDSADFLAPLDGANLFGDADESNTGECTALELFGDVLAAGLDPDVEDVRADRALLEACSRLARVVGNTGYDSLRLEGLGGDRRDIVLVPADADRYDRLRDLTMAPKAVLLRATLDTISATHSAVVLLLADGTRLSARLEEPDRALLGTLFGTEVTISGKLHFRPSGRPLHVLADSIRPAVEADRVFDTLPLASGLFPVVGLAEIENASGVSAFFGTWPGDETEEELLEALRASR